MCGSHFESFGSQLALVFSPCGLLIATELVRKTAVVRTRLSQNGDAGVVITAWGFLTFRYVEVVDLDNTQAPYCTTV